MLVRSFAAALVLIAAAGSASAQFRPKITFVDIRIGLPPGKFVSQVEDDQQSSHIVKRNTWAPVYVKLKVERELDGKPAWLRIDAPDADDLRTTVRVPLPNMSDRKPGEFVEAVELPYMPFVRAGDRGNGDVRFTIENADGSLSPTERVEFLRYRDAPTYVVLGLGSKLPGFDLPSDGAAKDANAPNRGGLRNGHVESAAITSVARMPDQWFGYAAADVVVLTTGSAPPEFLAQLFTETGGAEGKARLSALLEWVRRGGRLVISVGANAGILAQSPAFRELLPLPFDPAAPNRAEKALGLRWQIANSVIAHTDQLRPKADTFAVANLKRDAAKGSRVLLPPDDGERPETPVVAQAAFGLGRITVVGFDLDRSPFLEFPKRPDFWDWLLRVAGSEKASVGATQANNVNGYDAWSQDREDEYASAIRTHIDSFEGVPVISFGWVALFIALYTLLIGPVEYLFLKKIVGRLELTWITFPLIVLSVSAAAYFTAYAIKGNDLRINKVDLVDVDPASGRIYGRAWFTVFSPRIDSYAVGIDARDGWSATGAGSAPPTLVDWMAGGRGGGGNIVSRGYSYYAAPEQREYADGLLGVPIQVWSTKAFSASWSGHLDATTPLVESGLYHPPADREALTGQFVNRLPTGPLTDAVLIYAGKAYKIGAIAPGATIRPTLNNKTESSDWFTNAGRQSFATNNDSMGYGRNAPQQSGPSSLNLWGLFFHEKSLGNEAPRLANASLRDLDQSWRATGSVRDQAILVAKLEATSGPTGPTAEEIMTSPEGVSPTRLWLRNLPSSGEPRVPVPGMMRQETYIRVYLPVRATPPEAR